MHSIGQCLIYPGCQCGEILVWSVLKCGLPLAKLQFHKVSTTSCKNSFCTRLLGSLAFLADNCTSRTLLDLAERTGVSLYHLHLSNARMNEEERSSWNALPKFVIWTMWSLGGKDLWLICFMQPQQGHKAIEQSQLRYPVDKMQRSK